MNCTRPFRGAMYRMGFWLAAVTLGLLLAPGLLAPVYAGTFGQVVPIGGQAGDIALDEPRGVLYIANFTANRIDVMSLTDYSIKRSISVADQPSSLSVSPDGKFLVIVHFGNVDPTLGLFNNALSLINLQDNSRR